jgi:hypothetical protein
VLCPGGRSGQKVPGTDLSICSNRTYSITSSARSRIDCGMVAGQTNRRASGCYRNLTPVRCCQRQCKSPRWQRETLRTSCCGDSLQSLFITHGLRKLAWHSTEPRSRLWSKPAHRVRYAARIGAEGPAMITLAPRIAKHHSCARDHWTTEGLRREHQVGRRVGKLAR